MPQTCLKQTAVQGSQRELFDSHESWSVAGRRIKGVVPPRRGKNTPCFLFFLGVTVVLVNADDGGVAGAPAVAIVKVTPKLVVP
jgi:hypothetical protein